MFSLIQKMLQKARSYDVLCERIETLEAKVERLEKELHNTDLKVLETDIKHIKDEINDIERILTKLVEKKREL